MHTANLSPDKTIHIIIFTTAFEIAVYTIHCILNTVNYRRHCIPKPHHLLPHLNPDWFYLSGTGLPGCPGKQAVKRV